jgi:hypothetical protein
MPAEFNRLIEIAKVQSTEASNDIEGIRTTNTRLKQLCDEKTTPRNRDEEEIMGYRDVLNTIHESYEYIPIRSNYILQPRVRQSGKLRWKVQSKNWLTAARLSNAYREELRFISEVTHNKIERSIYCTGER